MTDLTSKLISNTYKQVILVSSSASNTGVSTSLKAVQTGDGTNSALKIATNAIQISGVLEASGSVSLGSNLRVSDKVCASSFYGDGSNLTGVTATIAGNISVSNATIGSNLYVGGTVTVAGATHLQAAVSVGGAAKFGSTVSVSGAAHLKSTVSVGGAATFASTVTVVGAALLKNNVSIGGTLAVAGAPTFTSKATFSNDVSVSGRLDVATSACIGGLFRAVGAATFDGDVSVSGGLVVGGTVTILGTNVQAASARVCASAYHGDGSNLTGITGGNISGNVSVSNLNVYNSVSIGGNLFVNARVCASTYYGDASNLTGITASIISSGRIDGSLEVSAALTVGAGVNIGGTLTVAGATSLASTLSVGGAANFASTVTVVGATHLKSTVTVGGAANFASTVTVVGAAHLQSTVSVGGAANFASTVTVVGAATYKSNVSVSGNMDVAGNVSIGGTLFAAGGITYDGDVSVSGNLAVGGNVSVGGTLSVTGAVSLASTLSVGGASNFLSTVTVAGNTRLGAVVSVVGAANFASTVTVVGATHLKAAVSVGGAATFASTVTVVGATHLKSTVTVGGAATFASTVTVVGATHLQAAVSVGGATQLSNTLTVGVDDTGYDVKFFGATASRYLLWDESADSLLFSDSAKAIFGQPGNDLQIYHDGNNSFIHDNGTGLLSVRSNNFRVQDPGTTEILIDAIQDGAVVLYHNGNAKIATASTGVTITGEATATGFTGTLDGILGSGSAAAASVTTLTTSGIASIDDTTDSTSGTTGSIHTDGGLGVAKALYVGSTITAAGNYHLSDTLGIYWGNNQTSIHASAAGAYMGFVTGNAEQMRMTTTGLGIGTTAPDGKLHVMTASAGTAIGTYKDLTVESNTNMGVQLLSPNNTAQFLSFGDPDDIDVGQIFYSHVTDSMAFKAAAAEIMRINSTGLGIGQVPTKPFQVYANSGLQFEVHQDIASPTARFMMEGGTALAYQYANGATNTSAAYSVQGVGSHLWYGVSNTGTLRMTLNATGLGIGVTPGGGQNFSFGAAGNAYMSIYDTNQGSTGGTDGLCIGMTGVNANIILREAGILTLYTSNTARMTIAAAGTVNVVGTFTAGTKTFRIDHPLPSMTDTHHLLHSSIEGPQADLIYRGRADLVAGTVDVNIDTAAGMTEGTFELLCGDVQCFTSNEDGWTALKGSVTGNVLTITAQDNTCTDTVSWMVIGERKDAKMIESEWADDDGKLIVETLKSAHE